MAGPIFKQDKTVGLRTLLYMVVAIVLMVADRQSQLFHHLRQKVAIVVSPVEYLVSTPLGLVEDVVTDVETRHSLVTEDAKQKAEILLLQARVQKMLAVESENKQLRELLQSSSRAGGRVLQAQILAASPNPYLHQIIIDKGSAQGVYQGQPVVDAYGVMGQVIQVGEFTSRVLLLIDSSSAIPVQDSRSGVRAIAYGDSRYGNLDLRNVTQTADIKKGDLLITSGLGRRYPYGYPVGTVQQIQQLQGAQFLQITAQPAAHIERSRLVLLVWPVMQPIDKSIQQGFDEADKLRQKQLAEPAG